MRQKANRITSGFLALVMLFGLIGPAIPVSKARDVNDPEPHVHTFACYEEYWIDCDSQDPTHNHSVDCYTHSGELVCGLEEGEIHIHGSDGCECQLAARILTCNIPEHIHDETCVETGLNEGESDVPSQGEETNTTLPPDGTQQETPAGTGESQKGNQGENKTEEDSAGSSELPEGSSAEKNESGSTSSDELLEGSSTEGDTEDNTVADNDAIGDGSGGMDQDGTADISTITESGTSEGQEDPIGGAIEPEQSDLFESDTELSVLEDSAAPIEELVYICGIIEHEHTFTCYQEIWKCRKVPETAPMISSAGFTPVVKNTMVATSSKPRVYFGLRLTEGDENSVIMPESKGGVMVVGGLGTGTYVDGTGSATFNEIGFTAPGSYKFAIYTPGAENRTSARTSGGLVPDTGDSSSINDQNYKYDERVWKLMVEVAEENGKLVATGTYSCPIDYGWTYHPETTDGAEFITIYKGSNGWNSNSVRQAKHIMESMTLEEKVGQLFLLHYPGDGAGTVAQAQSLIEKYHPGGYLVFASMFENSTPAAVRQKIADTQAASSIPLLFSVDEEGGIAASGNRVVRISKYSQYGHAPFQSPQELKASGGLSAVTSDSKDKAAFLKDLGLNINHAPVADVSAPGGMMYGRTWGGDGVSTAEYVETLIKAYNGTGVGTTMKHFPGYGATSADTHNGFAVNDLTRDEFDHNDLLPFYAGIAAGGQSVMVTHNTINCLDTENPASLSPAVYNLLRNEMGFDGVAMTDDLAMKAITNFTGTGQASLRALQAGADMAMTSTPDSDIPAVLAAVKNGSLSLSEIDEKCRRILCWKIELGLIEEEIIEPVSHNIKFNIQYDSTAQSSSHTVNLTQISSSSHVVMPNTTRYHISASGNFYFEDDIIFKEAGTYKFRLYMTCADEYIVEPGEWILTVNVTYSNGKLSAAASYGNETTTTTERPSFLIKKVPMSADVEQFIALTKDLPYASSVKVDNLDSLRTQIAAIMEIYNRLSDDEKELPTVKNAKNGRLKDLQTILGREDNLSDGAKEFVAGVNSTVVPSFVVLDKESFNSFISQVEGFYKLYISDLVTEDDIKALSVKEAKKVFDGLNTAKAELDKAMKYVETAAKIDLSAELTYENYQKIKDAYYEAQGSYFDGMETKYPFTATFVEVVKKAKEIIDREESLSSAAQNYVDSVSEIRIPAELTSSSLTWLRQEIAKARQLEDALSGDDRMRVYVKNAANTLDTLQAVIDNEDDLSARAQAFVISVERIHYSIPFTNESFDAFKAALETANNMYDRLSGGDKRLVVIRDEEQKLRALEAIRDREINLNETSSAFVNAVNSIQMPNPPEHTAEDTKVQIETASALYYSLSSEDLNRLLVINMKAKLNTLCVQLEDVVGLSETAKAFIAAVNEIRIPDPIDGEFLNILYSKFNNIDQLYGRLTDEDKEWFSVREAIKKMALFIDIMNDKKAVHYEVQYYAYFNRLASEGDDSLKIIDTRGKNLPRNGDLGLKEFFMWIDTGGNAALGSTGKIKMNKVLTQLYDSGNYNLVSEYGISRVDKLRDKDGYKLSEIWVLKEGRDPTSTDTNDWIIHTDVDSFTLNPAKDALDTTIADLSNNMVYLLLNEESEGESTEEIGDGSEEGEEIEDGEITEEPGDGEETGGETPEETPGGDNPNLPVDPGRVDLTPVKNIVVRLVYDENSHSKEVPVKFYDYDITDGVKTQNPNYIQVNSSAHGINDPSNYAGSGTRFSFGNANTGVGAQDATWVDRYGITNKPNQANRNTSTGKNSYELCTFGIASALVDGKIQYSPGIDVPNLFDDGPANGKTAYDNGEFSLEFDRFGDTYTLQKVNKAGVTIIDNLDQFKAIVKKWKPSTSTEPDKFIWSNSFWPMDYVPSYGGENNDPAFGSKAGMIRGSSDVQWPASDDALNHNSYFGMTFAVKFDVPADYIGPLEYYFFGDDDLWVFLDGQLICDIGGCHSSVGEYVDLWDYVERGVESSHTLTFFYTERGASGSSCYMRYTLPSVTAATDIGEVSALHFNPKIIKTVEGTADKDKFEFTIRNIGTTEGVAMPSNTTCTIEGAGEGIFNMISFVRPGIYQFEITEIDGKLPGYVYDSNAWTLTLKVGISGTTLYVESVEYSNPDGTLVSTKNAQFVNQYVHNEAYFTPRVTKEILNANLIPEGKEETFKFQIIPLAFYENVKSPDRMTTTITGAGTAEFGKFRFLEEGAYKFMISEDIGNVMDYEYDRSMWTLTVTVVREGATLVATGVYERDVGTGTNTEAAVFTNSYKAGKLLPKTGGEGLFPVYAASAGILVCGAAIWLIRKRIYR